MDFLRLEIENGEKGEERRVFTSLPGKKYPALPGYAVPDIKQGEISADFNPVCALDRCPVVGYSKQGGLGAALIEI